MAIFRHFPNRDDLLRQVVNTEFEKLVDFFRGSADQHGFGEQMILILDGYIDYAMTYPRIFYYVFSSARRFPEDFRARRSPTLNLVADAVHSWMRQKRLKRDDVWEIAVELWAQVHGYLNALSRRTISLIRERVPPACSPLLAEVA